jgi:4-aminobutyrate aminotransferase
MTNSGTESVESAIKLARYHTGRPNFIGFLGGFHGRTLGAVSFTASKNSYHRGFYPLMNGVVHAPFPDPDHPILHHKPGQDYGEAVVEYIENQILEKIVPPEEVAGILVEPIQGEGGYIIPAQGFFPALRRLCDRHGILLMVDEVQAGMGRTGKWWAIQNFGVEPDIVCTAKGIASGIPLGAMIARKSIVTWPKGSHGNTYGGNPIACAAALATLDLLEREYIQNAAEIGAYAIMRLKEMQTRHPAISAIRGIGLMIGVDLTSEDSTVISDKQVRDQVVQHTFEHGLLTLGCGTNTIRISPPLCITRAEMDEGLEIFEEAVHLTENYAESIIA